MGSPLRRGAAARPERARRRRDPRPDASVGASGKLVTAAAISARDGARRRLVQLGPRVHDGSVGCIQAQRCHTNRCPVGVTTQNPKLQRALVVPDKAERVHNFHRNTVHAVAEMIAAVGVDHPSEIGPDKVFSRISHAQVLRLDEIYPQIDPGELLAGTAPDRFQRYWNESTAESFRPQVDAPQAQ